MSNNALTIEKLKALMAELGISERPTTTDRWINPLQSSFCGQPVFSSPHVPLGDFETQQFRFPRSKRRRIRKKWEKRAENFRSTLKERFVYMTPYGIHANPSNLRIIGFES